MIKKWKRLKELEKENEDLQRIVDNLHSARSYWRTKNEDTTKKLIERNHKIDDLEKIINELKGLSEMYEVKKNASDYWFNKFNSTKIELNRLIIEKKELVNSIEKMKFDNDMLNHYISSLKNTIKMRNSEIQQLKYLNNFFSIVIKENFGGEETVIKQYLDNKLNLLIDQNAPECLKSLIQNLIDELNNN